MPRQYHIGLVRSRETVIVQCRRNIDFLSCEIWHYLGERVTTKNRLKGMAAIILKSINLEYGTNFERILIN